MAIKNYRLYKKRRARLGEMIGEHGIIVVPGAKNVLRNADTEYPFRQESGFSYLTGFTESDALLIVAGGKKSQSILFCNPKDEKREIWTGKRFGPEEVKREFGFHDTFPNTDVETKIQECSHLLRDRTVIYSPTQRKEGELLHAVIDSALERIGRPRNILSLDGDRLLGEMRLIKDEPEVAQMTHAANISANAHREILSLVRHGMTEVELEAEFAYRFRKMGGDPCHAYPPIVAAGMHACTLHHTSSNTCMRNGDLVLVDAGCEYEGYASDITRTFPVNGKFTLEQRAIYAIVLAAQKTAIEMASPGEPLCAAHDAAVFTICEGLMALGLLEKIDPQKAIAAGAHHPFFPHGTSHWLGLDVHDVGDYINWGDGKKRRVLLPGMVITVEPGIYIPPKTPNVEKRWLGIGVRIEDDVLITTKGNIILSKNAPKEIAEVEELMGNGRKER